MVHEVRNQPLGRLLIRLLDGEVDFVFISSMAAVLSISDGRCSRMRALSAALSRSVLSWLKVVSGSDGRLLPVIRLRRSLLLAAGRLRIMQPGRDAGEDRSMPREGYFILDSDQ